MPGSIPGSEPATSGRADDLGSLTSDEVAAASPRTLLIPLGATEQHGPHLPLATDTTVAALWAGRVADIMNRSGHHTVVAPPLPYGSSGEHQMFPGTLSIGHDALRTVVIELARSAGSSFDRVAFLSGHAGNREAVGGAVDQLRDEGHRASHFFPSWPAEQEPTVDAHAGRTETSLLLHLQPATVRTERLAPGDTRPLSTVMATLMTEGVAAVSPNGVLGDPTEATAAEGARLLDSLAERTAGRLLAEWSGERSQYDSEGGQ